MHNTKIAALAVAATLGLPTLASADSNVTVYGLIDLNVGYERPATSAVSASITASSTAAAFGFKGNEDLGNGQRRCSCSKADSTHPPAPPSRAAGSMAARPTSVSKAAGAS